MQKIIIIIVLFCNTLSAQAIKSWQNYSNFKEVTQSLISNNLIWVATSGGAFSYYLLDSSYQVLTKSEGLVSQSITAIAKDNENKIWLGTSEGYITIYNPATGSIKTILEIYKTDKSIKSINSITISGDTAYVSTAFGISLIRTTDFAFFDSVLKFGDFASETPVKNIYLGSTTFVVTQAGIAYLKPGSTNLTAPESWGNIYLGGNIPANRINKIIEFEGSLYAATDKGLVKNTNGIWSVFLYPNFEVFDILKQDIAIYSLLENTIHKYDVSDIIYFGTENTLFNSFIIDEQNTVYISSNRGLIKFSPNTTSYIYPNGPEINSLTNIAVDVNNNLWAATGKDNKGVGVLSFDGKSWASKNIANTIEFISNDFHKVSTSGNAVYFSSWGAGFVRLREDSLKRFDSYNTSLIGIPEDNNFLVINDIKEDENKNAWILNYWAANKNPLSVLTTDDKIFNFEIGPSVSSQIITVNNLIIDQYNTKWFAGNLSGDVPTEGLFYFNENNTLENLADDTWGRITQSTGLRNKDIRALAIDKFGEIIIGTSIGVDVIPNPSSPTFIRGDQYFAVRQQTINSIAVDPINQKWFGTEKGIFLLSSDGSQLIANFTKSNSPLPTDKIKSIAIDSENGIVYVGTDFGLTEIATLYIKSSKDFSDINVYPNPITLNASSNLNLVIDGLVEASEIKVLDISGNLVNEFRSIGGKTTYWNCRDLDDKLIPSGIYIIVAYDSEVNQIGHAKLAVLRK